MKYGIVDIGSNTFRLIIAEIKNGSYFVIDGFKENVRLAAGLDENNVLSQEKIDNGIKSLKMLVGYCRLSGCSEIRVTATAALRRAVNRQVFIDKAKEEAQVDVELLSGEEEATYGYVASANSIHLDDYLFMDIGGGSTEIGWVKNRQLQSVVSLPFGSVDLARKFHLEDIPTEEDLQSLREFCHEQYQSIPWIHQAKGLPMVGIGGTIRTIGKIQKRKVDYPLSAIHHYFIQPQELSDIYQDVSQVGFKSRHQINGLSKDRADIFVGACGAVYFLSQEIDSEGLLISREGLREGLLYEKLGYGKEHVAEDPLRFSVENMMNVYQIDSKHSQHVFFLFKKLFEELKPLHQIEEDVEEIIYIASMLHDVGKLLDYKNHHEHTFYIMLNSLLSGIDHKKQLMATLIAGNHTDSKLKIPLQDYLSILTEQEICIVDKLSVLMKLAEGLDRSLSRKVKDILCRIVDPYVIIKTINYDDISLEIAYLRTLEHDFKQAFKKKMIIV